MFEAKVVKDSMAPSKVRLTTMVVKYPRAIHAELMTHRMFSRNASSSRAIPVKKLLGDAKTGAMWPVWWGANQAGMQAKEELQGWRLRAAKAVWWLGSRAAIATSWLLNRIGMHKQIANRPIEPFSHITVVLTGTDAAYANFFYLRRHPDAQPEMKELADRMYEAYRTSWPKKLQYGDWHLPFVSEDENRFFLSDEKLKMSVARCARVSYLNHDGTNPNVDKDMALHDTLLASMHASPFEHQAMAMRYNSTFSGNFHGWEQYRKQLPNEYRTTYAQ